MTTKVNNPPTLEDIPKQTANIFAITPKLTKAVLMKQFMTIKIIYFFDENPLFI